MNVTVTVSVVMAVAVRPGVAVAVRLGMAVAVRAGRLQVAAATIQGDVIVGKIVERRDQ